MLLLVSPRSCSPSYVSLAVRVAGYPGRVSLVLACWYAILCHLCNPRARSSCPFGARRVSFCGCGLALQRAFIPRLSPALFARPLREVPWQGAGRAVRCASYPSAFLAPATCTVRAVLTRGGGPALASPFLFPGGFEECFGLGTFPPTTARSSGAQLGPLPFFLGRGVRVWGPVTEPTTHTLWRWCCALWGWQEGGQVRAPGAFVWGVRARALSFPQLRVLGARSRGLLSFFLRVQGSRVLGPDIDPTARALAFWLCALLGWQEGA